MCIVEMTHCTTAGARAVYGTYILKVSEPKVSLSFAIFCTQMCFAF